MCSVLLTACNNDNDAVIVTDSSDLTRTPIILTQGSVALSQPLSRVVFTKGEISSAPLALNVGFGSGAYHRAGDDSNIFYTITVRGSNIKCSDTEAVFIFTLNHLRLNVQE